MNKYPYRWFGPKVFGWGWRPVSWQGYLITLLLLIVLVAVFIYVPNKHEKLLLDGATLGAFCIIAYLTSGKPGSELLKNR